MGLSMMICGVCSKELIEDVLHPLYAVRGAPFFTDQCSTCSDVHPTDGEMDYGQVCLMAAK